MRKSGFTKEQMVKGLREAGSSSVEVVSKKHGASEQTLNAWSKRFGVLAADEVRQAAAPAGG